MGKLNITPKILSAILAALLMCSFVISCGAEKPEADTTASLQETTAAETEAESTEVPDNLPEGLDFGGKSFRMVFQAEEYRVQSIVEEETGDVVNDAVYEANRKVEERFNVSLEALVLGDSYLSSIKKSIQAGDNSCEAVSGHDLELANATLENFYIDVNTLPYLDYDKPWWPKYSVDSLTVGKSMVLISNFMTYENLHATRIFYINKPLADSWGLEMPYDKVRSGVWTLDELISMSKDIYSDVNGNGERDTYDLYGWVCTDPYAMLESFGITPIKEDADGLLYIDINNEKTVTLMDKITRLLKETSGGTYLSGERDSSKLFTEGLSVFHYARLGVCTTYLRDSEIEYGMVPIPKYDELQEDYISGSTDRPVAVPISIDDPEFVGCIIEAMTAEGWRLVRPAFFEIALKNKYSYDADSAEMLDIVGRTIILDFSYIYSDYGGFAWTLMDMVRPDFKGDFASYYAKNEKKAQKRVDKLNEFFAGLNG
ncbi:MAG: hypothetical protein GX827_08260 [Clostridiales bacterium]|nr:hypothetical protein [Clostridiales bacterium]